ncbi:phage head morphogenesis protein [Geobacter pelophilus]|uniref:Phage head morphogenesis protein n=1 Tax=Geoanaerobacter pelophilus TaxID=60036 RepID=A0AAW4L4N6_9BACT|nr:phage minor head protein [Geoanaerobacter pelophilus]MBT0664770.1 phage head morphogenesis protein [Geoanaerobacter pelophilus]
MTPEEHSRTFNLPFNEAETFFQGKLNIPTAVWDDLQKDQHAKGFMIAGANKAELLADFRAAVQKSINGQMTLPEFQSRFDEIVAKHGWSYNGSRNWRSELIYNINVRTAYMAGRWEQLTSPGTLLPFLTYRHADGVRHPRPVHVSWNGLTLPANHRFWKTNFPPNGWGCHCTAFAASQRDRQAAIDAGLGEPPAGWDKVDPKTGAPVGIDKGWDYNVGMARDRSYQILGEKFETLPNDIARSWMREHVNGPAFERFIEGKIGGEFPVAVLNLTDMAALDTEAQSVWFSQDSLLKNRGELPTRSAGHPELTLAEYRLIPEIIDQGEVYRRNDEKLIYLLRGDTVYRAVLKKTKDGSENYFLSLFGSSNETNAIKQVAAKYEKVR